MVAITGQVGTAVMGTDAFQEVDILGMTLPVVKHSYVVRDPADISRVLGLKAVSRVPSVFNRAMLLRPTPRTVLKTPPMRILPSGCTAVA